MLIAYPRQGVAAGVSPAAVVAAGVSPAAAVAEGVSPAAVVAAGVSPAVTSEFPSRQTFAHASELLGAEILNG